jgi:lysophospholipase L1-like esterase
VADPPGVAASPKGTKSAPLGVVLCFIMFVLAGCGQLFSGQSASNHLHTSPQAKPRFTYVAIGASDTFGFGTSDPYTQNWASDLADELGPRFHLINLGIPGIVIHTALGLELPIALDAHPDLVTIWLGVNDIADNVPVASYSHDLNLMLSRLQAGSPHVQIAIANIPDIRLLPHFKSFDQQALYTQILNYNAVIAANVQRHHIIPVNLFQQTYDIASHPEYISSDGLHPNELGYQQLAEIFYETLQRAKVLGTTIQ